MVESHLHYDMNHIVKFVHCVYVYYMFHLSQHSQMLNLLVHNLAIHVTAAAEAGWNKDSFPMEATAKICLLYTSPSPRD